MLLVGIVVLAACGRSAAQWTEEGDTLLRANDLEGAEHAYNKALAEDPHYAPAIYGKGWALTVSGFDDLEDTARQLFERSIDYDPDFFGGYRGRGVLLLTVGSQAAAPGEPIIDAGGVVRTLTPEQRAKWVEAMKPVWDEFKDDVGQENIDAAQAINASM